MSNGANTPWWNVWRRWKNRYTFGDFVFDTWALHYARECHEAGDFEGARRWLDRMRLKYK